MNFKKRDERGRIPRRQTKPQGGRSMRASHPQPGKIGRESAAMPLSWHEEARFYIESIGIGIAIGIALIAMFFLLAICAPMMVRRNLTDLESAPQTAASHDALVSKIPSTLPSQDAPREAAVSYCDDMTSRRLPQIDWEDILTDEERANMSALRQDVRNMLESPQFNVFAWPVLPYPTSGLADWDSRFENFNKLLEGVYNEEPELSVYTNGQNTQAVVAVAKYHLGDAEGSTPQENMQEYRTVIQAANQLDSDIRSLMAEPKYQQHITAGRCSEDELYAMLLYRELGRRTTYSDGVDDTIHENDIYGALVEGESKCYGMACATKALLNRRGIPSLISSGSVNGDDEKRHAWVTLWVDGQWKVLDLTYAQGIAVPVTFNAEAGTTGQIGYWGGCLEPYEAYIASRNMKVDQISTDLMSAYARRLATTE